MASIRHYIDGKETYPFREWEKLEWTLTYEQGANTSLSIEDFVLFGENYKKAKDHFLGGKGYIGLNYDIIYSNGNRNIKIEGYLHKPYFDDDKELVRCRFSRKKTVTDLFERMSETNFGTLESQGFIDSSKYVLIPTLQDPVNKEERLLTLFLLGAVLASEIAQWVFLNSKVIAEQVRNIIAASTPPDPEVWAIVESVVVLIALAVAFTAVVFAYVNVMQEFYTILLKPIKDKRALTYRSLAEAFLSSVDLELKTNITQLDYGFLPSNPDGKSDYGIPSVNDYGYNVRDFFRLLEGMYNVQYAVKDDVLYLYPEKDSFWTKNSTYVLPEILELAQYEINLEDLNASKFYKFQTDSTNAWTVTNFDRSNRSETTLNSKILPSEKSLLAGLERKEIQTCLISQYDEFTVVDNVFRGILRTLDTLLKVLGQPKKFKKKFDRKLGAVKFDNDYWERSYIIPLSNGKVIENARDVFNSNTIASFYPSLLEDQKYIYNDKYTPMTDDEFFSLLDNSTFSTSKGTKGRFKQMDFVPDLQKAKVSFEISDEIVTDIKTEFKNG